MGDRTLEPAELINRAITLATIMEEVSQVEAVKKEAMSQFNVQLKDLREKVAKLARTVRTGLERKEDQIELFE